MPLYNMRQEEGWTSRLLCLLDLLLLLSPRPTDDQSDKRLWNGVENGHGCSLRTHRPYKPF